MLNARVFLLIATNGLFMAIWSGDQAHRDDLGEIVAASDRFRAPIVQLASTTPDPVVEKQTVQIRPVTHSVSVPVPQVLPPGDYRAVSQSGTTSILTIPESNEVGQVAPRDFYMHDDVDGERWYFIRLNETPAATSRVGMRHALLPSSRSQF